MVQKEKQMACQIDKAESYEITYFSGELIARGYGEDFCVYNDLVWDHPIAKQIRIPLSRKSVAFTSHAPRKHEEAYRIFCDFNTHKVHLLFTTLSSFCFGAGIIPIALTAVNHVHQSVSTQNFSRVIDRFCGNPTVPTAGTRKRKFFSLQNSR